MIKKEVENFEAARVRCLMKKECNAVLQTEFESQYQFLYNMIRQILIEKMNLLFPFSFLDILIRIFRSRIVPYVNRSELDM